jgi:hypothetical protein
MKKLGLLGGRSYCLWITVQLTQTNDKCTSMLLTCGPAINNCMKIVYRKALVLAEDRSKYKCSTLSSLCNSNMNSVNPTATAHSLSTTGFGIANHSMNVKDDYKDWP